MKRNHRTAKVLSMILVLATCIATWIVYTYLPISPERLTLTMGCVAIGLIASTLLYCIVTSLPDERWIRVMIVVIFGMFASVPILSVVAKRITYSRFGFTVFGAIPIPVLDVTVNRHGVLWFRPKTHQITRRELDALLGPDVEVVIVGIGWDSIAQLTDDAKLLSETIDMRVLPTPEAFALYNELIASGRRVVLLAHSTC